MGWGEDQPQQGAVDPSNDYHTTPETVREETGPDGPLSSLPSAGFTCALIEADSKRSTAVGRASLDLASTPLRQEAHMHTRTHTQPCSEAHACKWPSTAWAVCGTLCAERAREHTCTYRAMGPRRLSLT